MAKYIRQSSFQYFERLKEEYQRLRINYSGNQTMSREYQMKESLGLYEKSHAMLQNQSGSFPIDAESSKIDYFVNHADESDGILIDLKTFYVMDISHSANTDFNSLVFQLNRVPYKTKESTSTIMQRYFRHTKVSYDEVRLTGKMLGYKKKCPYVVGKMVYLPERGLSSGTSSWIALHHVLQYEVQRDSKFTLLFFRNQHKAAVPMKFSAFYRQLERSVALYNIQIKKIYELSNNFGYMITPGLSAEMNVIEQAVQQVEFPLPAFSAKDFEDYKQYFKIQEILTRLFGEGDPYIKEALSSLKMPPFGFKLFDY